jgi:RNA polymerase sigma-70 factor, ECF subfamily
MRRGPNKAEFDDVFRSEYPSVLKTVRFVLGEREAAEDVVQDAFSQLLVHWDKVSRYERPGAWVRRVALRRALRWRTRRLAEAKIMKLAVSDEPSVASDPDLFRALCTLPATQRAAVLLHYLEDRPLAEVADLLGCAEGTAKAHLFRARQHLAKLLREGEPTDVAR